MADCAALRPLFQAYLDGEVVPQDRDRIEAHLHTCQNCRDDVSRAAWEVGLFLLNRPSTTEAAAPSAGFTDRVMRSIQETPRAAEPATPVASAAPVRLLPPAPPVAPVLAWRTWAAAAAFAATAAAVAFVFLNGEPTPVPSQQQPNPEGEGVVVACNGGALRWTDRDAFDRGLAGSVWIAKDEAVPALPGEYLHSPAPSSIRVRLPGGGQFDAGPSSSLAFSPNFAADRTVVILEGALTASAPGVGGVPAVPGAPASLLSFDAPGVHVESSGAVELSVRVEGGAKAAAKWYGARAEALQAGTEAPVAPDATVLVFAREGQALVATSAGPVRNSLERHTLNKGQALVLSHGRVYLQRGVDDDAPPEGTAGLPIPPDSLYFPGSGSLTASTGMVPTGGGAAVMAAGPVRNSLERALGDPTSDPEARADALALYESVGGIEAVEAAAKAVDDPAIQVRCAAVRILALNSWADRPKALAALRRLALDADSTIAVFAIRALRALEDREAIPMLRTLVVDDDAPPDEVQVAAFGALVYLGEHSKVAEAAERLGHLDPESVLAKDLRSSVMIALQRLPKEVSREFLVDSRPGVKAAALLSTNDEAAARDALKDSSPIVQLAGVDVILQVAGGENLDAFRPLANGGRAQRNGLIRRISMWSLNEKDSDLPQWVLDGAQQMLEDPASSIEDCTAGAHVLDRSSPEALFNRLLQSGTLAQRIAVVSQAASVPRMAVTGLSDPDPTVRSKAIEILAKVIVLPESVLPTSSLVDPLIAFSAGSFEDARFQSVALMRLARERKSQAAYQALLGLATSTDARVRRASAFGLGALGDRPEAAVALEALLHDGSRATSEVPWSN